jgi:nucleotide-binding universal stress UspA family protein
MKMLLAVDGSETSVQAVRHALALVAGGLRASFVLANVQEPPNLYEVVTAHDPEVIREVRGAAGADLLAPAEALLDAAGVDYESEVAGGDPAHLIVELAENYACDAIVLGAGENVAVAVAAASPVPVTLVPGPDTEA